MFVFYIEMNNLGYLYVVSILDSYICVFIHFFWFVCEIEWFSRLMTDLEINDICRISI